MIYVLNAENKPQTNKSIIAEPIDALEIYEIVNLKFNSTFIDLDIKEKLLEITKEDILIFIYDYILPLHTERTLENIKNIIDNTNSKANILISKQCLQNKDKFFELGFTHLIYTNPEYTINILIECILTNNCKNIVNTLYKKNEQIIKSQLDKTKVDYITIKRDFDMSKYNDVRTMITSIGCNNKCKFCPTPYYQGEWRSRSIDSIIEEIKYLSSLGTNKIMFLDDNFTNSKARIYRICNAIKQAKIKCTFGCLSSINNYSYSLFKTMYKAGFRWVHFGIESGSNDILKLMNKDQKRSKILKVLKEVKKIGFNTRISRIIDYPKTTNEDILKTFELIKRIMPNEIRLHYTAFRTLTPLYNEYKIEDRQYIHNNNVTDNQLEIKTNYEKFLKELGYDVIDDSNYNWNSNSKSYVAAFVPIKYGRNWEL